MHMATDFIDTKVSGQESLSSWVMEAPACAPVSLPMSRPLPSPSDRAARLAERLEHQRKALEYLPIWFKAKNVSQRTIAEHIGVLESSLS
ncbi:MAG: hypothetical protein ACLGIM_21700, partial [Alphaproteobacteria bacterium]